MKRKNTTILTLLVFCMASAILVAMAAGPAQEQKRSTANAQSDAHAEHGEHDDNAEEDAHVEQDVHAEHAAEHAAEQDEHDGHTEQDSHAEHAEHVEDGDIQMAQARPGKLIERVSLPGEIALNADRLAHIVPRVPGIVREVRKSLGDTVKAGEIMAVIESSEIGKARVDYLGQRAELGCCAILLTRAQKVHENTLRLVEFLKRSPALEAIRDFEGGEMGEYRERLVSAYAEFVFAKAAYTREAALAEQKISSENDFLTADNALKKAEAGYLTAVDSSVFRVKSDLLEAQQEQQVREMELQSSERTLLVLGLTSRDIANLEATAAGKAPPPPQGCECGDPDCEGCALNEQGVEHRAESGQTVATSDAPQGCECGDPDCEGCAETEHAHGHKAESGQTIAVSVAPQECDCGELDCEGCADSEHAHGHKAESADTAETTAPPQVCDCGDPDCEGCADSEHAHGHKAESGQTVATSDAPQECDCGDPNCQDHATTEHGNAHEAESVEDEGTDSLAHYALRAPFDGTIIEKHITLGEKLSDDANAFTIADLSTVWIDFKVFQKDLASIKTGQRVTVMSDCDLPHARGRITYVAPTVSRDTRTALGRVVLPNTAGRWRPGLFVTVQVGVREDSAPVVIPKSAVQTIDGETVVFTETAHGIEPTAVALGRSDATNVEILAGLSPGDHYVAGGAFALKAEIITSGLDPHAGHGH